MALQTTGFNNFFTAASSCICRHWIICLRDSQLLCSWFLPFDQRWFLLICLTVTPWFQKELLLQLSYFNRVTNLCNPMNSSPSRLLSWNSSEFKNTRLVTIAFSSEGTNLHQTNNTSLTQKWKFYLPPGKFGPVTKTKVETNEYASPLCWKSFIWGFCLLAGAPAPTSTCHLQMSPSAGLEHEGAVDTIHQNTHIHDICHKWWIVIIEPREEIWTVCKHVQLQEIVQHVFFTSEFSHGLSLLLRVFFSWTFIEKQRLLMLSVLRYNFIIEMACVFFNHFVDALAQ